MLHSIDSQYRWIILLISLLLLTTFNPSNSNFGNIFFNIKNIEYNKTLFLEESLKAKVNDLLIDQSLLLLDKKKIKDLFAQNKWVKSLVFKKEFPNKLHINVEEYYPIGFYKFKKNIYLINSGFRISLRSNDLNLQNLIEFQNIKNLKEIKVFVNKLKTYRKFLSQINKIEYIHKDRWNVFLQNDQKIKFGQYNLKNQINYLEYISKDKKIKIIDLRNEGQIVISYEK